MQTLPHKLQTLAHLCDVQNQKDQQTAHPDTKQFQERPQPAYTATRLYPHVSTCVHHPRVAALACAVVSC